MSAVPDEFPDWTVVAMFYTALHAVETLFAYDGSTPHDNHHDRNRTLKNINRYKKAWASYRPLFDAARSARYDPESSAWLTLEQVRTELVKHLYRLEKSVQKLMNDKAELRSIWDS